MGCSSESILRDLKKALKGNNLRRDVERIIKKCSGKSNKELGNKKLAVHSGMAYFINDRKGEHALKIFKQVLDHTYHGERVYEGLYITRANPMTLDMYEEYPDVRFVWLSTVRSSSPPSVAPSDLAKILQEIKNFLNSLDEKRGVVFIQGAEAIITNTDFNRFIKMIQAAKDAVSQKKGLLIMPVNLNTLSAQEQEILSSELVEIPWKKS